MKQRKLKIDQLKYLCAFFVIYVHCSPTGSIGESISAIVRIAVPIFFIITGYFYKFSNEKEKKQNQIKHVFALCIISNLIYLIWNIVLQILLGNSVKNYLLEILEPKVLAKFLFFNESPVGVHLWYLGALLYGLGILYLFQNKLCQKIFYIAIPVLLMVDLIFGKYSLVIFERQFPVFLVRNFLFVALPYLGIGIFLREKKVFFDKYITSKICLGGVVIGLACVLFEKNILDEYNCNALREQYLGTTFLAVFVFLYFAQDTKQNISVTGRMCSQIGREYAAGIYILHPIIITIVEQIIKILGIYRVPALITSVFVLMITVILVWFMQNCIFVRIRGNVND